MDVEHAQVSFARWVDIGTRLGLALLVAGFAAYVGGLLPPHVPFAGLAGACRQVGRQWPPSVSSSM